MSETIRVNFAKPIALFPLPDAVLLPHALLPIHILEPRYRQMIDECLDRSGQLAIATFKSLDVEDSPGSEAATRDVVCVGQIIQHDALPDGRYNILLHGVCRARIKRVLEPCNERDYRMATIEPLEPVDHPPEPMPEVREDLRTLLCGRRLQCLRGIETLTEWINREDVPTHALLELIGFAVVRDTELKYKLLAEADPIQRAVLIKCELQYLDDMVRRTGGQSHHAWPKGMSWN